VETELFVKGDGKASLSLPEKELPSSLPWHSTLVFEPQDPAWRILYTRAEKPVLIERSYGKGSIVLSSDSFFLSNEAMKRERYPQLLSWLCGPHRKIVFDETHLGVSKSPGIATLLRKYGLAPFFISLIVLALLAIWKQAARPFLSMKKRKRRRSMRERMPSPGSRTCCAAIFLLTISFLPVWRNGSAPLHTANRIFHPGCLRFKKSLLQIVPSPRRIAIPWERIARSAPWECGDNNPVEV
jgi:hypothetical protein